MPLHAQLVHDWAASWVFAATDAQHTLQERTGVGQRPAAESGMPPSICYQLPWPPDWCCSRQPCSCGGETTVVWTRRNHRRWSLEFHHSGRIAADVRTRLVLRVEGLLRTSSSVPPQTSSPAHQVPHGDAPCRAACSRGSRSKGNREGMRTRVKNLRILEAMIDCD